MKLCTNCKRKSKINIISGQAFCRYKCNKCGKVSTWHNTNVPKICWPCATENELCMACGKELSPKSI